MLPTHMRKNAMAARDFLGGVYKVVSIRYEYSGVAGLSDKVLDSRARKRNALTGHLK